MAQENKCPQCGANMPPDAPEGLCPKCLMKAVKQDNTNVTLDGSAVMEGPGTKIGRYELLELIGEGGMGLVYLAEQKEPVKRRVALKIIKPGMDSKEVIARFEAERQALALLDHPNIAQVFDAGTTDTGRPYFVMEYVKGMSITRYCDEHRLDVEQRLRLFREVCEGVHHAHQKGIIHRDIKPSNILISIHGDRAVPKIIDFGIAKAAARKQVEQALVRAENAEKATKEKSEELRRTLYVNSIQLADAKYREANIQRVHELLESCPNDLRGWEWYRLNHIMDQSVMTLRGHSDEVHGIAVSPDGKRIISGSADKTVKVWDSATGAELMTLHGHNDWISSVAFSPDGKRIISGSGDNTIKVWNSVTGAELMTLVVGLESDVSSVAFSPDGKTIAAGSFDDKIRLWESTTPPGGYEARGVGATAKKIVDELHEEHSLYSKVIDELNADETLDKSVRKVALQIANARLWEDEEKAE